MAKDSLGNIIEIGDEVERVLSSHQGMKVGDRAIVVSILVDDYLRFETFKGEHTSYLFKIISKNKQQNNLNLIL